jgi:hypothetical protein
VQVRVVLFDSDGKLARMFGGASPGELQRRGGVLQMNGTPLIPATLVLEATRNAPAQINTDNALQTPIAYMEP